MIELGCVAVYCGSSFGASPVYTQAAEELGAALAARGITLVYGGGHVGLMGVTADAVLGAGGKVIGVITDGLQAAEVGHEGLTELEVVDSMHARKARMAALADGFLGLAGGFGTFDELLEVLTWNQLGLHAKPVVVLNVEGFYDPLVELIANASKAGFMRGTHAQLLRVASTVEEALEQLSVAVAVPEPKWADRPKP